MTMQIEPTEQTNKIDKSLISQPIFIVGAERSGTTVLRLMLDHHPQLAFYHEFEYAVDWIADNGCWPQLEEYYQCLETDRIFQASNFVIDHNLSYPQLLNSFLRQKRDQDQKPLVGATVHRNFDKLVEIWPNARFIHIIRDARDVARSCIGMGWAGNVWTGVERWIEAEILWHKLCQTVPEEQRTEVRYENLISDSVNALTNLCEFMGLPYNPAMLSYPQTTSYSLPNPKLIYQWRNKLSATEMQLVEARTRDMLVERGYQLSGLPLLKVSPLKELRLKLQDWWARVQFRVQRLGLPLFMSDYLSRKLAIEQWQRQVKLQINTIEEAHLR